MLFRDQCVHNFTATSYVETDETITSVGYRVLVDGVFVTEMRVFRNTGTVTVPVNYENLIEFNKNLFFPFLNDTNSGGVELIANAKKVVKVKEYELVFTKATGVTVTTELGEVTMNDVIDGKFGNYFPSAMLDQSEARLIPLTNKFINGGVYYFNTASQDTFSFFAIEAGMKAFIIPNSQAANTITVAVTSINLTAGNLYVVRLNSRSWNKTLNDYRIVIGGNPFGDYINAYYTIKMKVSEHLDNLPFRRGTCYYDTAYEKYNLYIRHPYGGLDCLGNVNVVSVGGSSNRQSVRLQDVTYIHGGSANNFETVTQAASEFSVPSVGLNGEGTFSYNYEAYITNVDELWIAAMSASKIGYLINNSIGTIIAVEVNSISASIEYLEDGLKVWRLSVSCTQKVPFVA